MTINSKIIKGAGGGKPKSPPPPYRAPDTLHSRQFATVQDLISEGEIEGFATASKAGLTKGTAAYNNATLKDIFLNDTPILNANASNTSPQTTDFNFQDVQVNTRFGTSNQTVIPGIPASVSSPTNVGVTVTVASPVTRQIANSANNPDAVKVTLTWPQIQKFEDDGDVRGMKVDYKIQIQYNGGGFTDVISSSVSGRTADAYQKDHRINLTGDFPVDIRVVRVTADSTNAQQVNAFQFTNFTEIFDVTSTYPNSAYVNLRFDSAQFSSVPNRKFRIRGIKVRIPGVGASNSGTPTVDNATGRIIYPNGYIFNGVMGAAVYTNCPAMVLLDLLTSERFGFGDHITDTNLDLFSFVAASKYANELIDDNTGSGATEARFSCNINIQSPAEAFNAINELAGVMRCMPIWSAGTITITQDKPTTASYLFNLANVGEGGFSYSGSSLKQRHSIISVAYFNMDSAEIDYEVIGDSGSAADNARLNKLGHVVKQVKAFACTSRSQAARLGRAILFAEENESEVVTFSTSIDAGIAVRPGSVIEINDPVRAGARRGGRVVSATTTAITIDAEAQTTLPSLNDSPTISVILSDGTVEQKTITDITGAVLTVNSAFSSAPNVNAPYLISSTTLQTQLFRVIQVEEQDDINYVITALSYVEGKYNFIEDSSFVLPVRTVSLFNQDAPPPSNLTVSEKTVVINSIARSKLIISWQAVAGVTQYLVNYKLDDGNFVGVVTFSPDFEILDTQKGTYTIEVYSYNSSLKLSPEATTTTFDAEGKTALPDDVQNLTLEPVDQHFVRLRWTQSTAVDVLHGGRVYIRHTDQTGVSATFQAGQDIVEAVSGTSTDKTCPALAGTYLVKFQDDGGRFSSGTATVVLTLPEIFDSITVKTDREDTDSTPFNGTKTNVVFDSTLGGLKLINPTSNATGTYDFVDTLDLGAIFSLTVTRFFRGTGFYSSNLIDDRTELIDTWEDFDGALANQANATLAVRTTTDNPNSSPTYTNFNTFANGTYRGRGFQFRATLSTEDVAQNMNLQQLGYTATIANRTEQSGVIASGAGAKAVTFASPFFVGTSALGNLNNFLPSVNISPQNMATGDYFELSSISGTGFTVHFKNSSNASIDRNFTYSAAGFGKGG